jgi:hypothetical protein
VDALVGRVLGRDAGIAERGRSTREHLDHRSLGARDRDRLRERRAIEERAQRGPRFAQTMPGNLAWREEDSACPQGRSEHMLELLLGGFLYGALSIPLLVPALSIWRRRSNSGLVWNVSALLLLAVSFFAYALMGMNYEDSDTPEPTWLLLGYFATLVELFVLVALWVWRARARPTTADTT